MNQFTCAEAGEGFCSDLNMFLRRFCLQGKSFNSVPQRFYTYITLCYGVRYIPVSTLDGFKLLVKISYLGKFIVMYFPEKVLVNTTNEFLEEDAWLQYFPITLKSPFPNNKTSLLDYAARFVFLVRHDCLDNEIQPSNLRKNIIKDVRANRLLSYLILSWVIGKINANCKSIFSFLDEFQGSYWNETLVHRFQETFLNRQPSTLIIFVNVGRYSEKRENWIMRYMTYVGEYYDREKKHYMACHYSLLVHSFKNSKCVYCDSLGRSKPIFLDSYIQELILLLKNEAVHIGK